jgi:hypothetical protein
LSSEVHVGKHLDKIYVPIDVPVAPGQFESMREPRAPAGTILKVTGFRGVSMCQERLIVEKLRIGGSPNLLECDVELPTEHWVEVGVLVEQPVLIYPNFIEVVFRHRETDASAVPVSKDDFLFEAVLEGVPLPEFP